GLNSMKIFLRNGIMVGTIISLVYLLIYLFVYLVLIPVQPNLPSWANTGLLKEVVFSAPVINIFFSMPGIVFTTTFLPSNYCHFDITMCSSSVSIVITALFSIIFYFLACLLISFLFRNKK
ncbi:MAG: hypothetical protein AAB925_02025, partial [Patescibacteria group bacterium]